MLSLNIIKGSFLQTPARLVLASSLISDAQKGLSLYADGAALSSVCIVVITAKVSEGKILAQKKRLFDLGGGSALWADQSLAKKTLWKAGHPRKVGSPYIMLNILMEYSFL